MSGNNTLVHFEQGGAKLVFESGAELELKAGSTLTGPDSIDVTADHDFTGTNEFSGTVDVTGTQKQFGADVSADRTFRHVANVLLAGVNTPTTLLPVVTGFKYKIVGYYFRINGGALAGATDIRLSDTAGSPVDVVTIAAAAATEDAEIGHQATIANVTKGAGWLAQLTVSKGVQIRKTGGAGTTMVSIDVVIDYQLAA